MSLPRVVTFVSPDPTHATISWEYDVRGQVTLRALVKKDLYNENIFNWTCNIVRCPPGAIVHYRVEAILPKEEGFQTLMSRTVSTNNRWKSTVVATIAVELHEDDLARDHLPAQLSI
ncbi:hypothetical protein BGZ97_009129 [Linnemannia gamsii]|uniref:Uncharacterized protein n=1 Tax=Linnemannia gamsii TaxID=64522 RepID=A0A9P6RCU7_9FUNG|nr:hypothetical protein BGZ97_009129 [Linnemannia gamsii]